MQLAKERNQVVVHSPDVVHIGVGSNATLNFYLQNLEAILGQCVKANALLW